MKQHIIIVTLISSSFLSVFAQSQPPKEIQVEKYLTEAKKHIENENWRDSALSLGKIIELGGVPPSEFYFLLGKTFVRGDNFEKGKELLNEYLNLTGGKGEYHKQSLALMEEIKEYERSRCPECSGKGFIAAHYKCTTCKGLGYLFEEDKKCRAQGVEPCRICGGSGRIKHNNRTFTCRNCGGSGKAKCPWCKGTGYIRTTNCETCSGQGRTTSQIYCKTCDGDGKIESKETQNSGKNIKKSKTVQN